MYALYVCARGWTDNILFNFYKEQMIGPRRKKTGNFKVTLKEEALQCNNEAATIKAVRTGSHLTLKLNQLNISAILLIFYQVISCLLLKAIDVRTCFALVKAICTNSN